jgi:rhodanese-related sulfurtransferase
MKVYAGILVRALMIAAAASAVGLGYNFVSGRSLPLVYTPPKLAVLSGVRVPLVDEREAHRFLSDEGTVFVDTRLEKDYSKSRIKGAVFLQPDDKEDRFPVVQPLLPEDARLVLYCYGPECPMAEEIALFLAQLGYKNMMIMIAGFRAWEKAGYPIEKSTAEGRSDEGPHGSRNTGD